MNKILQSALWSRGFAAMAATVAVTWWAASARAGSTLGPLNPGFENGGQSWNSAASGDGSVNFVSFSNAPANGPGALGTNCVLQASDGSGNADLRSDYFSLGAATQGSNAISIDFDYNILNPFTNGDQIRVGVRFEDANGNFLGEHNFYLGTPNNDVGGTGWHHFHGVAADPTLAAVNVDIRISMNIFGDDTWHSGAVLYDNFSVKVTPVIGPNNNADFENGGADWNTGGSGGSAGSVSYDSSPTNGPSAPGTNCALMTSDGSGNVDLRVNNFYLGAATRGTNAVSVDFDYNILDPISYGEQIRVGLRFEDSNGGFLGEHNFHLGTPNNDVGGTGWHHFHGVAIDPTSSAVTADLRISMNVFGDDIWSSGPVLFDNFAVKVTRVIGPDSNGDFENGGANWNTGGPGGTAGSTSFDNSPTNGWSALGTNCVLMTSDGSVSPPNGNDLRVNEFSVNTNGQPVTISFDYNILNPINSGDQIRVGLRFFDPANNFNGEHNTYIGTPNGDLGGQGWKHLSETYSVPAGSVNADIRVSMNIFGDDIWSSGPVLFDNFTVITGTNSAPVANNITIGTVANTPVTRMAANGGLGATDPDGDALTVSYITQPAHGTVTTDGSSLTYVPNTGYIGTDPFTFAVSDGLGGLATATATAQVNGSLGVNKFTGAANAGTNGYALSFSGAPSCDYVLESAGSLMPPAVWTPVLTNSADGSGLVLFTNSPTGPAGFWRTRLLP